MRALPFVFLIALITAAHGAAKYVPANDSQPLIRRDLLPLDVDAIQDLAEQLALLADGPTPSSASLLRNRVQALTLSQRLSPAQPRTRAILEALANQDQRPKPDDQESKSAKREIIATTSWLNKLPSDSEGHHLSQLLLDILQPLAGSEPILQSRNAKDAPKRWKGVVLRVAAFEVKKIPPVKKSETPTPVEKTPDAPSFSLTALLTECPMFAGGLEKNSPSTPGLIKTSLVITKGKEGEPGELRFQPNPSFSVKPLHTALSEFFLSMEQPLPKGHNLNINTDNRRYLASNRENIAAPLAMMLDAALSGRSLRRNTIFFARLRADGSLEKPARAWEILLDLEKLQMPDGTRLIVGSGMLEEMNAFLVLDKATFFTKYEVIQASTFQSARELFYADGKPAPALASAIEGYQEVREKAVLATNFNTFLSLSTVESRLIKARDFDPQHLSALMLATQAIRRPAYYSRFMFAQELDRLLEDISKLNYKVNETQDRAIKDAYKASREALAPLERLVERSERLILDDAVDLLKKLNTVGRVTSSAYDFEKQMQTAKDLENFHRDLKTFRLKLRKIYNPTEENE